MASRKVVVTLDTYLSILAVVSSFCAIGITFYQAYLQRTQQYASVMPVLDSYRNDGGNDNEWHVKFIFVNNGIGPAFITKCEIYYKRKLYDDMRRVTAVIVREKSAQQKIKNADVLGYSLNKSDLYPTRIMPVGQEIALCSIDHKYVARWVTQAIVDNEIGVKIWYKSIYGEQWLFNSAAERVEDRNTKIDG